VAAFELDYRDNTYLVQRLADVPPEALLVCIFREACQRCGHECVFDPYARAQTPSPVKTICLRCARHYARYAPDIRLREKMLSTFESINRTRARVGLGPIIP
jgi:hypothetical protein